VRVFIIATEITVEDIDRYKTVGFDKTTVAVENSLVVFLYCVLTFYTDYILIILYLNSL